MRHADVQAALANSGWRRKRVLGDADSLLAREPLGRHLIGGEGHVHRRGARCHSRQLAGPVIPGQQEVVQDVLAQVGAGRLANGRAQLPHLVGALLDRSDSFRQAFQSGLNRFGYDVQQLAEGYVTHLPELDLGSDLPAGAQIGTWLRESF